MRCIVRHAVIEILPGDLIVVKTWVILAEKPRSTPNVELARRVRARCYNQSHSSFAVSRTVCSRAMWVSYCIEAFPCNARNFATCTQQSTAPMVRAVGPSKPKHIGGPREEVPLLISGWLTHSSRVQSLLSCYPINWPHIPVEPKDQIHKTWKLCVYAHTDAAQTSICKCMRCTQCTHTMCIASKYICSIISGQHSLLDTAEHTSSGQLYNAVMTPITITPIIAYEITNGTKNFPTHTISARSN